jgi:multicomponent Na+:H+ antiporter subunit A
MGKPIAHGRNIVNVILVDFRALDTLGEIAVLTVAGVGVTALLTGVLRDEPERPSSLLLRPMARILLPLQIAFSLFLLWRGHNEPGGGFIAGLVVAAAIGLYSIAFSLKESRRLMRLHPLYFSGLGLLVAITAGVIGALSGDAFLTGEWIALNAGVLSLDLGTPLLFDTGVYLVVIGTATSVLFSLMERRTADGDL